MISTILLRGSNSQSVCAAESRPIQENFSIIVFVVRCYIWEYVGCCKIFFPGFLMVYCYVVVNSLYISIEVVYGGCHLLLEKMFPGNFQW